MMSMKTTATENNEGIREMYSNCHRICRLPSENMLTLARGVLSDNQQSRV
jgi:hypothetical protein